MDEDSEAKKKFNEYIEHTYQLPKEVRQSVPRWLENAKKKQVDNHVLLADIITLADELGHPPDSREMDKHGPGKTQTYQERFGSYPAAMKLAGLEPKFVSSRQKARYMAEKDLLEEYLPDDE